MESSIHTNTMLFLCQFFWFLVWGMVLGITICKPVTDWWLPLLQEDYLWFFFPQRNPHASHKVRVESSSNTCCWVTHSARLGEEQVQFLAHPRQRSDRHLTKAGPVCGNLFLITPKPWFHIIKMMRVHLISFPTALMTNSFHCYLPTSFKIVMPSDVQDMYLFYI